MSEEKRGRMKEKYKLRITSRWMATRTHERSVVRSLVWEIEADAIACKELMDKATKPKFFDCEFVRFTEEESL